MRLKQIEKRLKEIKKELENESADLQALKAEADALIAERNAIMEQAEQRKALLNSIAQNHSTQDPEGNILGQEPQSRETKEELYKRAFLKTLLADELTTEERSAFTHTTENTGQVIPKSLQDKIYSQMEEKHPLLKDINVLRTGVVMSIVKHTTIVAGDAKSVAEGTENDDEQNTFVNVDLNGKEFSKHVEFSYRLGKMAIPAFEAYLVKEIAERIGSAMAKDIVAQIKNDLNSKNKITAAASNKIELSEVLKALGSMKNTGKVNVYCNNASLYMGLANITGGEGKINFLPNLQEEVSGHLLGKGIKEEDALANGEILFLDPNQFVYNVVQDITIERDKDIKKHVNIISGIAIAEGTLTYDKAGALLTAAIDA